MRWSGAFFIFTSGILLVPASGQTLSDSRFDCLLREPGLGFQEGQSRKKMVKRMREVSQERRDAARLEASLRGWKVRRTLKNGALSELRFIENGKPIFYTTKNEDAGVSTGANLVRANYGVQGGGLRVGVWDGGAVRRTHQEFGNRVVLGDNVDNSTHATHVGGTIAASGVQSWALGMAPQVGIDTYDWFSDTSEVTNAGATAPNQADRLYVSNHSYGPGSGWERGEDVDWEWWGNGGGAGDIEQDFGRYSGAARAMDVVAYNSPYLLMFWSAGNDRSNNPATGSDVLFRPWDDTSIPVAYDPAIHPNGDGNYRGGYDSIAGDSVAKNVLSIGAVNDAQSGGVRVVSRASMSGFSSWGPVDDGRIKPDIVANGVSVSSPTASSDTSYSTFSGTSMSSPNAAGSAILLVDHYRNLFPGQDMRASLLKGLIIHTADDLGTPGPDYQNGWGLMNAIAAADLIQAHRDNQAIGLMVEESLSGSATDYQREVLSDGSGEIKVTICWTDPAGSSTGTSDSRQRRLVNDLNLRVVGPDGTIHRPFVMPFVGNWSQGSMSSAATTGVNSVDNVEQVVISSPGNGGVYRVEVDFSGNLTNGSQDFSMVMSGVSQPLTGGFEVWQSEQFTAAEIASGLADLDGDFDNDGLPNIGEYVLGRDPKEASPGAFTVTQSGEGAQLRFSVPEEVEGVNFEAQMSSDGLSGWTMVPLQFEMKLNGRDIYRAVGTPKSGTKQIFMRLRFTLE